MEKKEKCVLDDVSNLNIVNNVNEKLSPTISTAAFPAPASLSNYLSADRPTWQKLFHNISYLLNIYTFILIYIFITKGH